MADQNTNTSEQLQASADSQVLNKEGTVRVRDTEGRIASVDDSGLSSSVDLRLDKRDLATIKAAESEREYRAAASEINAELRELKSQREKITDQIEQRLISMEKAYTFNGAETFVAAYLAFSESGSKPKVTSTVAFRKSKGSVDTGDRSEGRAIPMTPAAIVFTTTVTIGGNAYNSSSGFSVSHIDEQEVPQDLATMVASRNEIIAEQDRLSGDLRDIHARLANIDSEVRQAEAAISTAVAHGSEAGRKILQQMNAIPASTLHLSNGRVVGNRALPQGS